MNMSRWSVVDLPAISLPDSIFPKWTECKRCGYPVETGDYCTIHCLRNEPFNNAMKRKKAGIE